MDSRSMTSCIQESGAGSGQFLGCVSSAHNAIVRGWLSNGFGASHCEEMLYEKMYPLSQFDKFRLVPWRWVGRLALATGPTFAVS